MIYVPPVTTDALITLAEKEALYIQLLEQLQKDFNLANEFIEIKTDFTPDELKELLYDKVYNLIQNKFAEYLNLLYIIDVQEVELKRLDGSDLFALSEQVAFLILKREWQKVWFRNKFLR